MVVILLPAYNEEESLPKLLDRLAMLDQHFGIGWKILIVNDGSTDGTRSAALRHPLAQAGKITVVDHDKNRGLARAMETGLREFVKLSAGTGAGMRAGMEEDILSLWMPTTHTTLPTSPQWLPASAKALMW